MESVDDVLANLDIIQRSISSSNNSADIASVQYVCKNVDGFSSSDSNTNVMVKSLNILHDSLLLQAPQTTDEGYTQFVIKGILRCMYANDLYRMVDSVVLELSEDVFLCEIIIREINNFLEIEGEPDDVVARFRTLLVKVAKRKPVKENQHEFGDHATNESLSLNESPRPNSDMLMIKSLQGKPTDSGGASFTPRLLNITFLPQSLTEQWALAKTSEEVSMVLDNIILMYMSLSEGERKDASQDVSRISKQIVSTLRFDTTPVIVNSLKLLEALSADHAKEFIPDLASLFPRIQRYMDDDKVAIRHHALKLGGSLVVRLPFDIVGRFVFAAIECKPAHPEISLKLAALALLSISPSHTMSSNPLLSRIILIAGDFVGGADVFGDPRGNATLEVAKDTIALALMTLCFSTQHGTLPDNDYKNVEDMLPIKLSTILGIPPEAHLSIEICGRAVASDFPSLRQDSYLAGLATTAMEASLVKQASVGQLVSSSADGSGAEKTRESKIAHMSIKIPEFSVTPIKSGRKISEKTARENSPLRKLHFAPNNGVSVLQQGDDEDMSSAPTMESYQPSWTPKEMGKSMGDSSPWAHPSTLPSSPICSTPIDRSKLKAIKKGGRKPGSRLRARTADEALQHDDSMATELAIMPATAGNDAIGRLTGVDSSDVTSQSIRLEQQKKQQQQQIQKVNIAGRRGLRTEHAPCDSPVGEADYFSAKGFKKMETLEFSSDSEGEGGVSSKSNKKKVKGIAAVRKPERDPFSAGNAFCHSDDDKPVPPIAEDVKTFPANRQRQDNFSVKGSSYQRQTTNTQGNDPKAVNQAGGANGICQSNSSGGGIKSGNTFAASSLRRSAASTGNSSRNSSDSSIGHKSEIMPDENGADHSSIVVNANLLENPSGQDAFEYLERGQLEPCSKPLKDINKAVKELTTSEWPDIFYLLNTTRRLMVHHSAEVSNSGHLHAMSLGLMKQALNLRSAVAKNAILALEDMFFGLRHRADAEVAGVTATLVKRCADSSAFITGSIDDCFSAMIQNTSGSRALLALVTALDNRNQIIRGRVSGYIMALVMRMSDELRGCTKELGSLTQKLAKLSQDGSPDARMNSREIIRLMITNGLATRQHMESALSCDIVEKSMAPQATSAHSTLASPLHRTRKQFGSTRRDSVAKKPQSFSIGEPDGLTPNDKNSSTLNSSENQSSEQDSTFVVAGISPRGTGHEGATKSGIASRRKPAAASMPKAAPMRQAKKMSQIMQDSVPELVELPLLLLGLSNKNWQERRDAVTHLTDHLLEHFDLLTSARKTEQCVERLLEIFEDGSVKVVQHAIACVKKIHLEHKELLTGMLLTSLPAVLNVASSANRQINAQGSQMLKMLLKTAPSSAVPRQLVNQALHDKDRLKAEAFRSMTFYIHILHNCEIEPEAFDDDDVHGIMKSIFFPGAIKTLCLSTAKPEVRTAAADVLRCIQDKVSEYIDEWTDVPAQRNEIKRILG